MAPSIRKVFLSSTWRDLKAHRTAVIEAINGLKDFKCICMEQFGAADWESDEFCRKEVRECDVFLAILGHFYGQRPRRGERSFTEREYDEAVAAPKPRLVFLVPESCDAELRPGQTAEDEEKQRAFRQKASSDRVRDTFASPEDLAWRVVKALHNWSNEIDLSRMLPATDADAELHPLPPRPWFVHPYPLQKHFTGRVKEREVLTDWLANDSRSVLVMEAIGGMGKSAVTWAWLQRDVLGFPLPGAAPDACAAPDGTRLPHTTKPDGTFWWSFYEGKSSFASFVADALTYASGGKVDLKTVPSLYDRTQALVNLLARHRYLLVLDGFERVLRAYCGMGAAYEGDRPAEDAPADILACVDPIAGSFLQACCQAATRSRVLMTTRLFPKELNSLAGCRREELKGFQPDDAVAFFHAHGIKGARHEIEAACAPYEYHPLALRLLAGIALKDRKNPSDIRAVGKPPVLADLKARQHHVLEAAYNTLGRKKRQLLSRIAAFRSPVQYDAIKAISTVPEDKLDDALGELESRGLLFVNRERNRYDLHPITRSYVYDRLGRRSRTGTHKRLCKYFAAAPQPDKDGIQTIDDLQPVIELYHHTAGVGHYDAAWVLYAERLREHLVWRQTAYPVVVELMLSLFTDGDVTKQPRIHTKRWHGTAMNELAGAYLFTGQTRRSLAVLTLALENAKEREHAEDAATALCNMAMTHMRLGELKEAEECLKDIGSSYGSLVRAELFIRLGRFEDASRFIWGAGWISGNGPPLMLALKAMLELTKDENESALRSATSAEDASVKGSVGILVAFSRWLRGKALTRLASSASAPRRDELLTQAKVDLDSCMLQSGRARLLTEQVNAALVMAEWQQVKGDMRQARMLAESALLLADRCEYRLCQADIHNFLAQQDLDEGKRDSGRVHAETAKERAWCNGPPYCYMPALIEAERLLKESGQSGVIGVIGDPTPLLPGAA